MQVIHFSVTELSVGGYVAQSDQAAIITQAHSLLALESLLVDAVNCHFELDVRPTELWLHHGENIKRIDVYGIEVMQEAFPIAHLRKSDKTKQALMTHLLEAGCLAKGVAAKLELPWAGQLLGHMHDFGKYSAAFQAYLGSEVGLINPDEDDYVEGMKGKIDHSSAGAQWVYQQLKKWGAKGEGELCAQMLAICIASHHSGLIDVLNENNGNQFERRMSKEDEKTHLNECLENADATVLSEAQKLATKEMVQELLKPIKAIRNATNQTNAKAQMKLREFYLGCLTKFLFSALIDADRINSADFEHPENCKLRSTERPHWQEAINRLDAYLAGFEINNPIDTVRKGISDNCKQRAFDSQGIYTLSVPTGGGKTLASLRYALNHAQHHGLDRIVFIIPYTSIIEQNAGVVRKALERKEDTRPWVLEHHSNLEPERETWHSKLITDNWDAPIVFTTMVQFLETCFVGGTRSVRRLHQLAKSVLIFDEVQTLPVNCTYLFCSQLNFLKQFTKTTAILCTATQPVLNQLPKPEYGLQFAENHEIVGDIEQVKHLFSSLKRVEIEDRCKVGGWAEDELADLIVQQFRESGSCLVIVNTKAWAKKLYELCLRREVEEHEIVHLSTNQCPAHRKDLLDGVADKNGSRSGGIKQDLRDGKKILCISTQLIEAGVDVSFKTVIRFLAGLDSIAQAAGRCNRNGELKDADGQDLKGKVLIVNPDKESTELLTEIEEGKKHASEVLGFLQRQELPGSLLDPEAIKLYFSRYFTKREGVMSYPIKLDGGAEDTLFNLLSDNVKNTFAKKNDVRRAEGKYELLMQSFMTAGKKFKVIDAPTQAVIVQYGEKGKNIVAELGRLDSDYPTFYKALRQAQQYSVNVFPPTWRKLQEDGAVLEVQDTGVFYLKEEYYNQAFGLMEEGGEAMQLMMIG